MILDNGPRFGTVTPPPSKSHLHRLLIADFLAGGRDHLSDSPDDSADIAATRRRRRPPAATKAGCAGDIGACGATKAGCAGDKGACGATKVKGLLCAKRHWH